MPSNKFNQGEDVYTDDYKTLLKEIEEYLSKRKAILCSWIGSQYY